MTAKRIAFCLSGQPRLWERCYESWYRVFAPLGHIDLFAHIWDFNSHPGACAELIDGVPREVPVPTEDLQRMVDTLRPKKYVIQSRKDNVLNRGDVKHVISPFSHSQFYSLWRSANLKRQYEIENDFEYDLVVRLRTDILLLSDFQFTGSFSNTNMRDFFLHRPNTLFTLHNQYTSKNNLMRVGDMMFAADSLTFDHVAMFYDSFSYIEADIAHVGETYYPPECALYYYCASLGIVNTSLPFIDVRVMRDAEHVARAGGKIEEYETT